MGKWHLPAPKTSPGPLPPRHPRRDLHAADTTSGSFWLSSPFGSASGRMSRPPIATIAATCRRCRGSGAGGAEVSGGEWTRWASMPAGKCHSPMESLPKWLPLGCPGPRQRSPVGRRPAATGPAPATGAPPRLVL